MTFPVWHEKTQGSHCIALRGGLQSRNCLEGRGVYHKLDYGIIIEPYFSLEDTIKKCRLFLTALFFFTGIQIRVEFISVVDSIFLMQTSTFGARKNFFEHQ